MDKMLCPQDMTADEFFFFEKKPEARPIYALLRARLTAAHPDVTVKASKTQLSFRNRYVFAVASFQRVPAAPKTYLLVSFGLAYEKRSPRIAVATEAARNRWTHHVVVRSESEIDAELLAWLEEAYQFSMGK